MFTFSILFPRQTQGNGRRIAITEKLDPISVGGFVCLFVVVVLLGSFCYFLVVVWFVWLFGCCFFVLLCFCFLSFFYFLFFIHFI